MLLVMSLALRRSGASPHRRQLHRQRSVGLAVCESVRCHGACDAVSLPVWRPWRARAS